MDLVFHIFKVISNIHQRKARGGQHGLGTEHWVRGKAQWVTVWCWTRHLTFLNTVHYSEKWEGSFDNKILLWPLDRKIKRCRKLPSTYNRSTLVFVNRNYPCQHQQGINRKLVYLGTYLQSQFTSFHPLSCSISVYSFAVPQGFWGCYLILARIGHSWPFCGIVVFSGLWEAHRRQFVLILLHSHWCPGLLLTSSVAFSPEPDVRGNTWLSRLCQENSWWPWKRYLTFPWISIQIAQQKWQKLPLSQGLGVMT